MASKRPSSGFRISCTNVPYQLLQRNTAKEYFAQFGKIIRMILKPKSRVCVIEYDNSDSVQLALHHGGDYYGQKFSVQHEVAVVKKKRVPKELQDLDWIETLDPEIREELRAMGASDTKKKYELRPEQMQVDTLVEVPDVKKVLRAVPRVTVQKRNKTSVKTAVPKSRFTSTRTLPPEQFELIKILKQPASTSEEKLKTLEARDKLLRLHLKKETDLRKAKSIVGTCPDMCPEKERLMRETQHQVALYEQENCGKGMNPALAVKQYSRSSADQEVPLPHELRPVAVLKMTMAYLMKKIMDLCDSPDVNFAEWYHFLWDRTRGIRKDITQQELCCENSVELIEQIARFHIHCSARLVAEDPSVFDQKINTENLTKCLQTLKYMYHDLQLKNVKCKNEAEFRAYIILLNLNDGNFMWEVQQLRQEIQKSPEVRFAIQAYSALDKNNYVKFFKLVRRTTYLNACILLRYFVQVRINALRTILKCFSPRMPYNSYPICELTEILAFEDDESTKEFLEYYGLYISEDRTHVVLDRRLFTLPDLSFTLDRAVNVIESKRRCSVSETVCGTGLVLADFENHKLQDSFDAKGFFDVGKVLVQLGIADLPTTETKKTEQVEEGHKTIEESQHQQQLQIFAPKVQDAVSDKERSRSPLFSTDVVDKSQQKLPWETNTPSGGFSFQNKSIFGNSIFGNSMSFKPEQSIFGKTLPSQAKIEAATELFVDNSSLSIDDDIEKQIPAFKITEGSSLKPQVQEPAVENEEQKEHEQQRRREEERKQKEKEAREKAEQLRKQIEKEKKRLQQKLEEEKRKKEIEEKERQRRLLEEKLRREQEQRKKREIQQGVLTTMNKLLAQVEQNVKKEKLAEIAENVTRRKTKKYFQLWREKTRDIRMKRKTVDFDPSWQSSRTLEEEANELFTESQDLTLKYMKRYKRGKPIELALKEKHSPSTINIHKLVYSTLLHTYNKLMIRFPRELFWKVTVSIPDFEEMKYGLVRLEEILDELVAWQNTRWGKTRVEKHDEGMPTVTYCLQQQKGSQIRKSHSDGLIFVAASYNMALYERISKTLSIFTKPVPVALLFEDLQEDCEELDDLIEGGTVSAYKVFSAPFTCENLANLIGDALLFLSRNVDKPPPLELDLFRSFLLEYSGGEIWQQIGQFSKRNLEYKACMKDPNIVIALYNENLEKLKEIVCDEERYVFSDFPECFKEHLITRTPEFLPCDYRYFPYFWKTQEFNDLVGKTIERLQIGQFRKQWPPPDQTQLNRDLRDFCNENFENPQLVFYKLLQVVLTNPRHVLWSDIMRVVATEKLAEIDSKLDCDKYKCDFHELFVVYDVSTLTAYKQDLWFYVGHPLVKAEIKKGLERLCDKPKSNKVPEPVRVDVNLEGLLKKLSENSAEIKRRNLKRKREMEELGKLVGDLKESMEVQKKINCVLQERLCSLKKK